jgi:hypothetical protein
MLEPSLDAYGSDAQRSALADFVELAAISGGRINEQLLGDYLDSEGWSILSDEKFFEPASAELDRSYEPEEVARQVFALLEERQTVLGAAQYPFRLDPRRVEFVGSLDEPSPYLSLLAITTAHAYAVDVPYDPERIFPDIVTEALREVGLNSVCFTEAREQGTFVEAITRCGSDLRLHPTPEQGLRSANANDAGVDVLAAVAWGDGRAGAWGFIGQATCGKSDSWRAKALQPSPGSWVTYLNTHLPPLGFLAVPHHIEPKHFLWLAEETTRLILDRVRLALFRKRISQVELDVCGAVFSQPVVSMY